MVKTKLGPYPRLISTIIAKASLTEKLGVAFAKKP